MKIDIKATNLELTDQLKSEIKEKISTIEKFFNNIIEVRVEVEKTTNHHQKGRIFRAEANVKVPKELIRGEAIEEDLTTALDVLKDKLKVTLRRFKEKEQDRLEKGL